MDDSNNRPPEGPRKNYGRRFGGWKPSEGAKPFKKRTFNRDEFGEPIEEAPEPTPDESKSKRKKKWRTDSAPLEQTDAVEDDNHGLAPGALGVEQPLAPEDSGRGGRKERFARKSARTKAMDFLARRGYSENELRLKLLRDYPADDVEDAVANARENGWLSAPEEIAERVAAELGRKKKGHRFVNQFLKAKGLPPVAKDLDAEVERARELLSTKLKHDFETDGPLPYEARAKAQRLLMNRGFDIETIIKALQAP